MFGGGNYEDPTDDAMSDLERIPSTVTPMYQPYITGGQKAVKASVPIYSQRLTDPNSAYADLMSGYTRSNEYQYDYDQLMDEQEAAAARGGYSGSYYDQEQQAAAAQGLMSRDEQTYYKNNKELQDSALGASKQAGMVSYQASDALANLLANNIAAEAGLDFKSTEFENEMNAQHANNMMKLGGQAAGTAAMIMMM